MKERYHRLDYSPYLCVYRILLPWKVVFFVSIFAIYLNFTLFWRYLNQNFQIEMQKQKKNWRSSVAPVYVDVRNFLRFLQAIKKKKKRSHLLTLIKLNIWEQNIITKNPLIYFQNIIKMFKKMNPSEDNLKEVY